MAEPEFNSSKILYPAIAVLIALSALFGLAVLPRLSPGAGGMIGAAAPDVTLPVAANGDPGARMQLAELKGQPVILDFWATWCGPCAVQAPILERISRRYQKKGLVVLGVNVDDPPHVASQYAIQKGLSYPILIDAEKHASVRYGVERLPSLVVIDRQGKVVAYLTGVIDEASLSEIVAATL
ncbi:thioredoxin [Sorangium cellulosum]|uniref:Thioredoxin n=1 Tax=Sorangium cellulosum TaxID=56 RepID=A0A4P2QEM6_SORCE|nr:TlpA disulfide reductase family protein [Sorangium cellulosum]AUX27633.1 thioredoxin [Sorangium cellulosum]